MPYKKKNSKMKKNMSNKSYENFTMMDAMSGEWPSEDKVFKMDEYDDNMPLESKYGLGDQPMKDRNIVQKQNPDSNY